MFHDNRSFTVTVVCLVAWPLNEGEASVDHVLIEPLLPFCKFLLISMRTASLTSRLIKTRSTPASVSFKGLATQHTTAKLSSVNTEVVSYAAVLCLVMQPGEEHCVTRQNGCVGD